jgi:uncharacterized protein
MPKSQNRKYFLFLCFLTYAFAYQAQSSDLSILSNFSANEKVYPERKVVFIKAKSNALITKVNPLRLFFGSLLFAYQKGISPQISRQCGFEISCSEFSKNCIQQHGLFKGIALSADRMSRCTRIASFDLKIADFDFKSKKIIDPVSFYNHKHNMDE